MAVVYRQTIRCSDSQTGPVFSYDDTVFTGITQGSAVKGAGAHNLCYEVGSLTFAQNSQNVVSDFKTCSACNAPASPSPTPTVTPTVTPSPPATVKRRIRTSGCCTGDVNIYVANFVGTGVPTANDSVFYINGECTLITQVDTTTNSPTISVNELFTGGCAGTGCSTKYGLCPSPSPTPSATPTVTPSESRPPDNSSSVTATPSVTQTPSLTPTLTPTTTYVSIEGINCCSGDRINFRIGAGLFNSLGGTNFYFVYNGQCYTQNIRS
jgi:hypothetical protein